MEIKSSAQLKKATRIAKRPKKRIVSESELFHSLNVLDKKMAKFHACHHFSIDQDLNENGPQNIFFDFLKSIFENMEKNKYDLIDIFIHKKGNLHAHIYGLDTNGGTFKKSITAEEFNNLNKLIKKSKRKLFNSNQLNFNINFLGTFLARDYDFSNANAIILFTKNTFLPAWENEQEDFLKFTNKLKHNIYYIITFSNIYKFYGQMISTKEEIEKLPQNIDNPAEVYHHQRVVFLGELLNTLRHELSNPLFGMKMTSQILAEEIDDSETLEFIQDMKNSIQRCEEIIKNFTELYHKSEVKTEFVLIDAIKETLKLTKSEHRTIKKNIHDNLKQKETITTNRTWFIQVLFNLIVNSSHAIKEKDQTDANDSITININDIGDHFHISIHDTGVGIRPENINNILKPFYTTKTQGTGLGLSICNTLVLKMNGSLHFESMFGEGTNFTLTLPKRPYT